MIIHRWQAPIGLTELQAKLILESEGLEYTVEKYPAKTKIKEHRHSFTEVRIVISGEMLFNISGNQVLLRPGDRLEIPANTRHTHSTQGNEDSISLYSERII